MAIFRKVHTSFWSDSFISELDNDQKIFYLYLMTNEKTKQCGVYEITKKQIAFDLGYSIDKVSKLLTYFISKKKIKYNDQTNEVALGNWLKYNNSTSPKVQSCINQEFKLVKDTVLIEYVKSMDTHSQEEQEEEEEEEEEKNNIEERKINFAHTLKAFIPVYGEEMIQKFYIYWSEPNKSQTKFRQEMEKTWDVEGRLRTWASRENKYKGYQKKTVGEQTKDALTQLWDKWDNEVKI
jgi:hypothetical protein